MPRQAAKNLLLKIETPGGSSTFVTLGMLTTADFQVTRNEVAATNKDSPNDWEEVDAGNKAISANGTAFFDAGPAYDEYLGIIRGTGTGKALMQIVDPGDGTWQGEFLLTQYGKSGGQEGNVEVTVAIRSATEPTFTPV